MRCLLALALLTLLAACTPSPQPGPALALTVPLFLDDAPAGTVSLPAGPGPWPLFAHLPEGLPAPAEWTSVVVEGAGGQVFSRRNPAAHEATEEARFYRRAEGVAFAVFLRVTEDSPKALRLRAERPSLAVPSPTAVRIRTAVAAAPAESPRLRVTVDGKGVGRIRAEELAAVERVAEPGRPQHVDLVPLATLVGLRVPLANVGSVTLVGETSLEIPAADLSGADLLALKPTRRGSWVYKRFRDGERIVALRGVDTVAISRVP